MVTLKQAMRPLARRPLFSLLVIVMLALGIGATTAIFSGIYQALLKPLDVPEPERLVILGAPGLKPGSLRPGLSVQNADALFSYPMFRDLEAAQDVLTGLAAHYDFLANLVYRGEPASAEGMLVSGQYFSVLGVQPALGRLIGPEDARRIGESPVAVLSHDYWQSRFGGDRNVIGETLTVNNQRLTIVGVAAEGFDGAMPGTSPAVFVPLTLRWLMQPDVARNDGDRSAYWLYLFGRLRPGVSREQAAVALNDIYRRILRDVEAPLLTGITDEQRQVFLDRPLTVHDGARGQSYAGLEAGDRATLLFGASLAVLLIVCVNVANLLVASGAARAGEMAVRTSVGASRGRLIRQLLAEAALLAVLGGLAGLPVAVATLHVIGATVPAEAASRLDMTLDPVALRFAAAATLATVLLFGLMPALRTSRADPAEVIKAQGMRSSAGRGQVRFRGKLIGTQIALSMLLLVLAGLFTKSLVNVSREDPGFAVDSLVSFAVSPLLDGYTADRLDAVYEAIADELRAEPGVIAVASSAVPVMQNLVFPGDVTVVGSDAAPPANRFAQANHRTGAGFFQTLSIPLLVGRDFTAADRADTPSVAIVNQAFVRKFGLDGDAVGKRLRLTGPLLPGGDVEIVGVLITAIGVLAAVAAAATYFPATRAARLAPMEALRNE